MTDQTNTTTATTATTDDSIYRVQTSNDFFVMQYVVRAASPEEANRKTQAHLDAQPRRSDGPYEEPLTEWEEEEYEMQDPAFGLEDRRDFIYTVDEDLTECHPYPRDSWGRLDTPAHIDSGPA